jgi:AhpD family alkylhydroperoxidase
MLRETIVVSRTGKTCGGCLKSHEQTAVNLGPRAYVLAHLELANWRPGDDVELLNDAYGRVVTDTAAGGDLFKSVGSGTGGMISFTQAPSIEESPPFLLGARIRERLTSFLKGQEKRTTLRAEVKAALAGVKVKTSLHLSAKNELEHLNVYSPGGGEGAEGLLLAFLFASNETFGQELRQCPYCERFFLSLKNPRGGPRPKFCRTEHQQLYDDSRAAERVRNSRDEAKKAAKAAKHK